MGVPPNPPCHLRIFHEIKHPAIGVPPCPISPPYLPKHVTPSRWRAHLHSPPLLHAEIIAEPVAASASTFQFCQGDEVNFAALLGSKVGLLYVVHCLWWNDSTEQLNGGLWTNHSSTMGITIREPTRRGLGTSWLKTEHSSAGAFQLSCWRRSGYWVPMGTPNPMAFIMFYWHWSTFSPWSNGNFWALLMFAPWQPKTAPDGTPSAAKSAARLATDPLWRKPQWPHWRERHPWCLEPLIPTYPEHTEI